MDEGAAGSIVGVHPRTARQLGVARLHAVHGAQERVRHTVFDSGHDYSRPMREAMYGWMTQWLKGQGDGSPLPDPEIKTDDLDNIRPVKPNRKKSSTRIDGFQAAVTGLDGVVRTVEGDQRAGEERREREPRDLHAARGVRRRVVHEYSED